MIAIPDTIDFVQIDFPQFDSLEEFENSSNYNLILEKARETAILKYNKTIWEIHVHYSEGWKAKFDYNPPH